jgi:hypothetical protein
MKKIDSRLIAEILAQFKPEFKGEAMSAESLMKKIDELKAKNFTGAICLSSTGAQKSSCRWILFSEGDIKLVFLEEAKIVFSEEDLGEGGTADIFDFSDFQVQMLRQAVGEEVTPLAPEVLEREKILKKYRLREPEEDYIDAILKGYREPTPEERRHCEEIILSIKRDLTEMFGENMANKMFDRQFSELGIDKENMTTKDIGTLLDSLQHTVLERLIGPERTQETIRRLKRRVFKTV